MVDGGIFRALEHVHAIAAEIAEPALAYVHVAHPRAVHRRLHVPVGPAGLRLVRLKLRQSVTRPQQPPSRHLKRNALESQVAHRVVRRAGQNQQLFEHRRFPHGGRHVVSRAGNVIDRVRGALQIPVAGIGQQFVGVLQPDRVRVCDGGIGAHDAPTRRLDGDAAIRRDGGHRQDFLLPRQRPGNNLHVGDGRRGAQGL